MRRHTALAAVMLVASTTLALAGDPVGHYIVKGTNPGGNGKYAGTVDVTKTGDTYKVVWTIGDDKYVGTAIGNNKFMAVSYRSGDNTGLALYGDDGDNWSGPWTYFGATTIGTEEWIRQ